MRRGPVVRGVVVVAVIAALLSACSDDDEAGGATPTTAARDLPAVTVDDQGYVDPPQSLRAGVVELRLTNEGTVEHETAFIEIGDTPLEQFVAHFAPVPTGGAFPAYAEHVAAPPSVGPGDTRELAFTLAQGTYAMICTLTGDATAAPVDGQEPVFGAPHFTQGMAAVVEVGPSSGAGALPADGTITARDHELTPDIDAGDTTIRFANDGPSEIHFASVSLVPEGTDAATAEAAFAQGVGGRPQEIAFSGVFSAGLGGWFTLPGGFRSGRTYLVVCLISDRAGGPPHAVAHDMYRAFTVD